MSELYLLDTSVVSTAVTARSRALTDRLRSVPRERFYVSVISYGEIHYGLVRRPQASRLREATGIFLAHVKILPWTINSAETYAVLRADMERLGKSLSALDLLIAAHALEAGATLVSNDRAFRHVPGLSVEDWTAP